MKEMEGVFMTGLDRLTDINEVALTVVPQNIVLR